MANCNTCGSKWDNKQTAPSGSFSANPFGLYDIVGNVQEWTCSKYDEKYNGKEKVCFSNMQAKRYSVTSLDLPSHADKRAVVRGCSWHDDSSNCRIANRTFRSKIYDEPSSQVGFRVVMVGGI
jgi:formylglycine-generating enzyme required for sulfatase activity